MLFEKWMKGRVHLDIWLFRHAEGGLKLRCSVWTFSYSDSGPKIFISH